MFINGNRHKLTFKRPHNHIATNNYNRTARGTVINHICILVTLLLLIFVFAIREAHSRRLQRCELAGQLYILDIAKEELPLWLCIAEFESRFNTDAIGSRNMDGSLDYGIFQISDKFWCKPQNESAFHFYNECNVDCIELMQDDITKAVKCAQYIKKKQGWSAWTVYNEFCNGSTNVIDDIEIEQCFS
ncbi:lysozyme 1B-like [Stomoxys calcitrans]|uniref:Glycosyl hydrolases family 22 (GH22) domain-containing protein n=1 Tax=Stomoxys calcitrans TaxID=35570 RepID=A0A1I8P622_STOCA|nr:lysozyme 1B-like [Stomoxys calcitrans]